MGLKVKPSEFENDDVLSVCREKMALHCNDQTKGLISELKCWINRMSETTSMHGMIWYTRTSNVFYRLGILLFCFFVAFGLPIFLVAKGVEFMKDDTVRTSSEFKRSNFSTYPNLTICYPGYFDTSKMKALNVSSGLANYLSYLMLAPATSEFAKYIKNGNPAQAKPFTAFFDAMTNTVDQMLEENNITALELYQNLAIDCESLIIYCEVHGVMMPGRVVENSLQSGSASCCKSLFHTEPFFTYSGTCFTTKAEVQETTTAVSSSMQIWLNINQSNDPDYDILLMGSTATERNGILFYLSVKDHPAYGLNTEPMRVSPGDLQVVGLRKKVADRRGINSERCVDLDLEFESRFGIPYTKANCELMKEDKLYQNCSKSIFYGIKTNDSSSEPPCRPLDSLNRLEHFLTSTGDCLSECVTTSFDHSVTTMKLDIDVMKRFVAMVHVPVDPEDINVMKIFFKTLDVEYQQQYQEGFAQFLSKVGGWLGLAFGASIITFIELFGFIFTLSKTILKACSNRLSNQ